LPFLCAFTPPLTAEAFYGQAQLTKATIIAESDGSMLPVVETGTKKRERRKHKRLFWKEARLSLAHAQGSRTPFKQLNLDKL